MIRQLKHLIEWLDKRFPPKVTVTQQDYDALADKVYRLSEEKSIHPVDLIAIIDRIEAIEARQAEIAKMLAQPKKTESELLREQFLRGEVSRPLMGRREVEKAK